MHDLLRVVPAAARQDRRLALGLVHKNLDHSDPFGQLEGGVLAGRSQRYQEVDAVVDLAAAEPANGLLFELTVFRERRDERRAGSREYCPHDPFLPFLPFLPFPALAILA